MRLFILAMIVSLSFLAFSLAAIRRHRLTDQAALLWLLVSLVLVGCSLALPLGLLNRISNVVGIRYASDLLLVLAVVFLVMLVFHLSVSLAAVKKTQTRLVQELAILQTPAPPSHEEARDGSATTQTVTATPAPTPTLISPKP
jgi:hypothetical protein